MSATSDLLDFVAAPPPLPVSAREAAIRLLGDTLAVGGAGAGTPGAAAVRVAAQRWGEGGRCRLLGTPGRLPPPSAAFVNAFAIHCLEWDAVHEPAVVHALSVVVAALLATIDARGGCAPDEALTALAIGVDVASGLGVAATGPLRFFRPAIAGTIGAALAAARLAGLERPRLDDVLGLAHAQCAGTMQAHVEGSIALPLQIGGAARAAVAAVDLADAGLTGPHDALDGPFGHFALFDAGDLGRYTRTMGEIWRIAEVSVKPFPSGRASHGVLGALAALLREQCIDPTVIVRIEAWVPPLILRLVGRAPTRDMTPGYARLCLPFLTALMLRDGLIDPRRFVPAAFADPALADLAAKLVLHDDGNDDPNALSPQRIVVTLADGTAIERAIPHTLGHPDAALTAVEARAKLELARALAPDADPRLFDDPLGFLTDSR